MTAATCGSVGVGQYLGPASLVAAYGILRRSDRYLLLGKLYFNMFRHVRKVLVCC